MFGNRAGFRVTHLLGFNDPTLTGPTSGCQVLTISDNDFGPLRGKGISPGSHTYASLDRTSPLFDLNVGSVNVKYLGVRNTTNFRNPNLWMTAQSNAYSNNRSLFVENDSMKWNIVNNDNTAVNLKIIHFRAKEDLIYDTTAGKEYTKSLVDFMNFSVWLHITNGSHGAVDGNALTVSDNVRIETNVAVWNAQPAAERNNQVNYDSNPSFENTDLFKMYFKVVEKRKLLLNPGGQVTLGKKKKYWINFMKQVTKNGGAVNGSYVCERGDDYFVIVMEGILGHVTANDSGVSSTVLEKDIERANLTRGCFNMLDIECFRKYTSNVPLWTAHTRVFTSQIGPLYSNGGTASPIIHSEHTDAQDPNTEITSGTTTI